MIDESFKGFTPPPYSSPFTQSEFDLSSKPARIPVTLEAFQLPVQLFEIKKTCDEYAKKSFVSKFFGAPAAISKIIEFNNQLNDRILTLNRNTIKIHSSLEDLCCDFASLQKEISENKSDKNTSVNNDHQYFDRISSLEAEQRQLKLMMSNLAEGKSSSSLIFWALAISVINIIVTYGIVNSLN